MQDRNEVARIEFAKRKVQQDLASGRAAPLDRFAAPIRKGSLVMWTPPYPLVFQVDEVTSVLDPRAPAGLVQVNLSVTVPAQLAIGQPAMSMVVVGSTDGRAHSALVTPDGASPRPEEAQKPEPLSTDPGDIPEPVQ